jgi:protein TonB
VSTLELRAGARESALWGASFVIVCALHLGAAAAFWHSRIAVAPPGTPPDAVLVDLEPPPKPVTPLGALPQPAPQLEPEPELRKEEPPPLPEPKPETREEEPPPPVKAEVTLPKPPPPKPTPPRPAKVESAPRKPESVAAPVKAAPAPMPTQQAVSSPSTAVLTWEAQVLARLDRVKRYPRRAMLRQQEGVVYLRFTIDRHGDVLAYSIARSSGVESLDENTLSLVERAKPFPPPPPELARDALQLVVPIRYLLR